MPFSQSQKIIKSGLPALPTEMSKFCIQFVGNQLRHNLGTYADKLRLKSV